MAKKRKKLTRKQLKYFGTARQRAALKSSRTKSRPRKAPKKTKRKATTKKSTSTNTGIVGLLSGLGGAAAGYGFRSLQDWLAAQGLPTGPTLGPTPIAGGSVTGEALPLLAGASGDLPPLQGPLLPPASSFAFEPTPDRIASGLRAYWSGKLPKGMTFEEWNKLGQVAQMEAVGMPGPQGIEQQIESNPELAQYYAGLGYGL